MQTPKPIVLIIGAIMTLLAAPLPAAQERADSDFSLIRAADAKPTRGPWGEIRIYHQGDTWGATNALSGMAVVQPGQSLHPAHRHAEEEFLVLTKGHGRWSIKGKDVEAREGDVLYVEPWVMHGLVNTGTEPLTFFVVRFSSKGVEPAPVPAGDHGR